MKMIVIGGFLGAGKTTAILHFARYYAAAGKKVGIVTNDQGSRLVDTEYLRANGAEVLAVEGGCFCCNFDEFTQKAAELRRDRDIEILLAEPVGSCTDLIATIYKPLLAHKSPTLTYGSDGGAINFSLPPLSVVADPRRVKRLMMQEAGGAADAGIGAGASGGLAGGAADAGIGASVSGGLAGGSVSGIFGEGSGAGGIAGAFPTEVNYLFDRQLKEAGIIAVNKCDALAEGEADIIVDFLRGRYPGADVLRVSAKTGEGMQGWIDRLSGQIYIFGAEALEIDYDIYARAEAALGWLNMTCSLESPGPLDLNAMTAAYMEAVRGALRAGRSEIAHLKCCCVAQNGHFKASITGLSDDLEISASLPSPQTRANLIINARVGANPAALKNICENAVGAAFAGFTVSDMLTECFAPSPPRPTHRIT